ncbi:MAG: adenylate/guanylate cyclase domain-containing protein [Spirochaetaceae bacterium]|jgi:adenylate cyclase|nr:adenylate/guanylate cyclase domain-containing protein [Spirochaetaceae bacterium]
MNFWKSALLGLAGAAFFSLLYLLGILGPLEDRIYDFFLRFRAKRDRIENVVFLDVDDPAIAYNGVFPWPRSITADGLLRLKEYGALAAIFDIEYIDKGPPGVDAIYLNQGLPRDFFRSFSEISSVTSDLLYAFKSGRISRADIDEYGQDLASRIETERDNLFARAQGVARDNDLYLAQASALFGKSWASLNLRSDKLDGEQAERRFMAEERFSRSIDALSSAHRGRFVDILPALPSFSMSAKGAGFTNVEIDRDGTRRRVYLAQNIYDHWYFQLAFSPLTDYLGNPEIGLSGKKLVMRGAHMPSGTKDVSIPLDNKGRMLLDWPPEDYKDSFRHISFADFSQLEEVETELEYYSRGLLDADILFYARFDASLANIPLIGKELEELFDEIPAYKAAALENCSDAYFNIYTENRSKSRALINNILSLNPSEKVNGVTARLRGTVNEAEHELIKDEAQYIASICNVLSVNMKAYTEISEMIENAVRDSFCILGRVDTGTTDIGTNPFWPEYVNVGTHAVVLDTILSESFITPLGVLWLILICLVGVPLVLLGTASLSPVARVSFGSAGAVLVFFGSMLVFRLTGVFFGPLGFILALIIAIVIREIISYAGSEQEKQFYRKAFATYTSEAVADEIAKNPTLLQLGGTKRLMSAIFTDVQGFSGISEKLNPEELVSLLNLYLTTMSNLILDKEGTIDKYEGDAIIAFFGAPLEQPDHALRACLSAVKIKRAEAELNGRVLEQRLSPLPLLTRIGINSGNMVAGNMGTDKKMNYTIMGDAVNLAARLEGVNKQYGTWILASDDTIRQTGNRFLVRRLDRVRVVGKKEPVQLYNILDTVEDAAAEQEKLVTLFHQSLDCFEQRDWKKAAEGFKELSAIEEKGPAQIFLKRCEQYMIQPPKDDWDGIFNLTEK